MTLEKLFGNGKFSNWTQAIATYIDRKYNVNYGTGTERSSEAHKKRVRCVELDMIFESVNAAANFVGAEATNISKCLKGKYKTCSGYRWQYVD